ncbi:hypothetical protein D3C81_1659230 [compost metagenome]
MQVVEVLVTGDFLVRQGQAVGLVAGGEGQAVGVVVDLAELALTFVPGLVVAQAGVEGEYGVVAHLVVGTEIVLIPEVLDMGSEQAGTQAFEWLVVHPGDADAIGLGRDRCILGAEFAQALFGAR